jgi:hypothetical protein
MGQVINFGSLPVPPSGAAQMNFTKGAQTGTDQTTGYAIYSGSAYLQTYSQVPSGLVNSSNTIFNVTWNPVLIFVFVNRLFQIPGVDYILLGSTITFTTAPTSGESIYAQGI